MGVERKVVRKTKVHATVHAKLAKSPMVKMRNTAETVLSACAMVPTNTAMLASKINGGDEKCQDACEAANECNDAADATALVKGPGGKKGGKKDKGPCHGPCEACKESDGEDEEHCGNCAECMCDGANKHCDACVEDGNGGDEKCQDACEAANECNDAADEAMNNGNNRFLAKQN